MSNSIGLLGLLVQCSCMEEVNSCLVEKKNLGDQHLSISNMEKYLVCSSAPPLPAAKLLFPCLRHFC